MWRSQLMLRFSSHWVNFLKPQEVCFLVFTGTQSASNFCRSSSSSWEDGEFRFSSLFTVFSAMVWAWKWRYHFFHQSSKTRRREHSMASRFWLAAFKIVRLFDFHFSLVYFSGLRYILARKMHHNAQQSDNNCYYNFNPCGILFCYQLVILINRLQNIISCVIIWAKNIAADM